MRMGANIKVEGPNAIIEGVSLTRRCKCSARDLRGGAALCIAAWQPKARVSDRRGAHRERIFGFGTEIAVLRRCHFLFP